MGLSNIESHGQGNFATPGPGVPLQMPQATSRCTQMMYFIQKFSYYIIRNTLLASELRLQGTIIKG